jgi:outer membrane cobalamin receptor
MNVRVPKNSVNTTIVKNFSADFIGTLQYKYVGERRDYGGSDNGFKQVILDDYSLINLYADFYLKNDYKLNFSLKYLFDEKYNEALNYNTPGTSINIKFKKKI